MFRIEAHILPKGSGNKPIADRCMAEAYSFGATGSEELTCGSDGGVTFRFYSPQNKTKDIERCISLLSKNELAWISTYPEPDVDWENFSRQQHEAISVADRITIRPTWVRPEEGITHPELLINPGQAFGTGSHESTWVVLKLLLDKPDRLKGSSVLDVGCGTGILALASLAYGAKQAVAFDLDVLAIHATRENALQNSHEKSVLTYCGPVAALKPTPFDFILANLLRTELEPVLPSLGNYLSPTGVLILGGLLKTDWVRISLLVERCGLLVHQRIFKSDTSGTVWMGLVLTLDSVTLEPYSGSSKPI